MRWFIIYMNRGGIPRQEYTYSRESALAVAEEKKKNAQNYDIHVVCDLEEYLKENTPKNPYPPDIFSWDNIEPATQVVNNKHIPLTRGRLNKLLHGIWQSWNEAIWKGLEE